MFRAHFGNGIKRKRFLYGQVKLTVEFFLSCRAAMEGNQRSDKKKKLVLF